MMGVVMAIVLVVVVVGTLSLLLEMKGVLDTLIKEMAVLLLVTCIREPLLGHNLLLNALLTI